MVDLTDEQQVNEQRAQITQQIVDLLLITPLYVNPNEAAYDAMCVRLTGVLPGLLPNGETELIALTNYVANLMAGYDGMISFLDRVQKMSIPSFVASGTAMTYRSEDTLTGEYEKIMYVVTAEFATESTTMTRIRAAQIVQVANDAIALHEERIAMIVKANEAIRAASNPAAAGSMNPDILKLIMSLPKLMQGFGKIGDGPGEEFKKYKDALTKKAEEAKAALKPPATTSASETAQAIANGSTP